MPVMQQEERGNGMCCIPGDVPVSYTVQFYSHETLYICFPYLSETLSTAMQCRVILNLYINEHYAELRYIVS